MARENQGLQITLIVFIMLALVLSVTTFLFYKQVGEERIKTESAQSAKRDADSRANTLLTENNKLKELMGFVSTDELTTVEDEFNKDMQRFVANFPSSEQTYRRALRDVFGGYTKALTDLDAETKNYLTLQRILANAEAANQKEVQSHEATATDAANKLAQATQDYNAARSGLQDSEQDLKNKLSAANTIVNQTKTSAQQQVTAMQKERDATAQANKTISKTLDEMRNPTFESPDGLIRYVSQKEGTVWINLGSKDGVLRQMTLSVYSPNINDATLERARGFGEEADSSDLLSKRGKGTIEVTEVLGDHLAQARILEDEMSNPIMPGDFVHTPLWAPGNVQRFALTNGMDIDGDGESDLSRIRNLITANGGIVDAYADETKETMVGQIDINTRYLVVGDQITEKSTPGIQAIRTQMENEAKRIGVRTITLPELLRRMGYKESAPVVTYGREANPNDFKARPDGIPTASGGKVSGQFMKDYEVRESSGTVSDLFRKRTPPQFSRGSAYQ